MSYKIDVLIFHAENDNAVQRKHELGWVSNFQKFLTLLLQQVLGKEPNIMLKSEADTITAADVENIAVIIPLLSTSFISIGNINPLMQEFMDITEKNKTNRIFKVLKQPIKRNHQPEIIQDLLPYELYYQNPLTYEIKEYHDFFSEEAEEDFWMKMVDLAYDIYESLAILQNEREKADVRSIYSRKTIYISETGPDLAVQRNIIKRELLRYGCKILPDHALPDHIDEIQKSMWRDLEKADLCIHLVGNSYAMIPAGATNSIVELQYKLSTTFSKQPHSTLKRFIWIPSNLSLASDRQQAFIEKLKRDNDFTNSGEIFQTSLEDFKNIIREELLISRNQKKKLTLLTRKELLKEHPSVYVIYDKVDEADAQPIKELIKEAGYLILTPAFEGELLDLRQAHINNLQKLDAAIIYQNKVNDKWVKMKIMDLIKAPGFGRHKPMKGRILVSEKQPEFGEEFTKYDISMVNGEKENKIHSLQEFLKNLTQ